MTTKNDNTGILVINHNHETYDVAIINFEDVEKFYFWRSKSKGGVSFLFLNTEKIIF